MVETHEECEECPIQTPDACRNCKWNPYIEKEVIIAEADDSDHIHGEVYETWFEDKEHYYLSVIGTQHRWTDKVKITIEQVKE